MKLLPQPASVSDNKTEQVLCLVARALVVTPLACVLAWLFFSLPRFTNSVQDELAGGKSLPLAIIHGLYRPSPAEFKALPLESWIVDPDTNGSLTERILARLIQSEAAEPDVWLKDDYRQAFVCVSLADRGEPSPFIRASYRCYGLHPDRVWPSIVAKRMAKLGREYSDWYNSDGNLKEETCRHGVTHINTSVQAADLRESAPNEGVRSQSMSNATAVSASSTALPSPRKPSQSVPRDSGRKSA